MGIVRPHDHVVAVQRIHDDFCVKIVSVDALGAGIKRINLAGGWVGGGWMERRGGERAWKRVCCCALHCCRTRLTCMPDRPDAQPHVCSFVTQSQVNALRNAP